MASRAVTVGAASVIAILLAAAVLSFEEARAATWQKKAAGTYGWLDAANWDAAPPNAPGAAADLNVGLQGNITVNLDQAITLGTLSAGDKGGTAGATTTLAGGTGGKPLTFEGATAGAPTAVRFALAAPASAGSGLNFACGIRLGGTSPLTITVDSAERVDCAISVLDLNGNTLTLAGPPRIIDGNINTGATWNVSAITGKGHFVLNGTGAHILNTCPDFAGTLTVNHGWLVIDTAGLPKAAQYVIAGAFTNHKKYPRGGRFQLGAHYPPVTALPDRLNHQATMIFRGGYFDYGGQGLDPSLKGKAVVEQVRQIRFESGMSEIRIANGNDASSSTTLLANDPTSALVRERGATLMIGGDDSRSAKSMTGAMGVGEKLLFASDMSSFPKGGGGADGAKNMSIIPWITLGTYYHPGQGQLVTYDKANGIRCLTKAEYFVGKVLGCPADSNVSGESDDGLYLGGNQKQTINAYTTESWHNADIGPGSTLTVTSGIIRFGSGPGSIGSGKPASAGTIDFGPAEGIIWTGFDTPYGPNGIGSVIGGSGGLTMAGNNVLVLTAANTYTGKTCVGSGILQVGDGTVTNSRLGQGDVDVAAGGTLCIKAKVANAIADTATVSLGNTGDVFCGVMDVEGGVNETVGALVLGGVRQPAGTYGSSVSAATHKLDRYFTGTGVLTVTSPAAGPHAPSPSP